MVDDSSEQIVVIDNGSGMMKAGIAGDEAPACCYSAIVGRPKQKGGAMLGVTQKEHYIGEDAQQKRGILNLSYPIANGIVNDWNDMELVWHHTFFNVLRVDPKDLAGVLVTEAPRNPKENRKMMCEKMFESFQVKAIYIAIQAVMSLYANGRNTGLVVDSGDGVTHTVPVYEGFSITHAIEKMQIAGREITSHTQKLLLNLGHSFTSSAELEIVKDIKEKVSFVALNYDDEYAAAQSSSSLNVQYTLPDKSTIDLPGSFRIEVPELLFKPELKGLTCDSMHGLANKSVKGSDVDLRKDLLKNIILSGGSTMYEGIEHRLKKEMEALSPAGSEIKIVATADRKYSVWKGASTLASLSTFHEQMLTKDEWDESGENIIAQKFP